MGKKLGELLKEIRSKANITQQQLSELIHKSLPTVRKYENGERTPPISTIIDIAEALNADILELLFSDEEIVFDSSAIKLIENEDTKKLVEGIVNGINKVDINTNTQLDSLSKFIETVTIEFKEIPEEDIKNFSYIVASWLRDFVEMAARAKIEELIKKYGQEDNAER